MSARRHVSHSHSSRSVSPRAQELVFKGSVPLAVYLDTAELPSGSDRTIECYYVQAPRNSYLPLLLPELRKHLVEVALDESSASAVANEAMWLSAGSEPWKWHWPIGLLYDYHIATSTTTGANTDQLPFRLTLHLSNPPADKLPIGPSIDACRTNFMNMVKEADFVRWGNTRRVTGLRKAEQDALWEGVVDHDFDKYWSIASKLLPPPSSLPVVTRETSTATEPKSADAMAVRSVPLRFYLPSLPVLQDVVPPVSSEGRPTVLYDVLSSQLPLIFPPRSLDMTASFLAAKPLARAIIQGVVVPMDVHVGWLCALMTGADGWVSCVIRPIV